MPNPDDILKNLPDVDWSQPREPTSQQAGYGDYFDADSWESDNTAAPDWQQEYTANWEESTGRPPEEENNPLDDWRAGDWQNAEFNPEGESLPQGAQRWDYNGDAYYGDGLKGWWNGLVNRLAAPVNKDASPIAQFFEPTKRVAGALFNTTLGALSEPAQKAEQILFGGTEGLRAAGEGSPLPESPLDIVNPDIPDWLADFIPQNIMTAYQTARVWTSPQSQDEKEADINASLHAGRIGYSAMWQEFSSIKPQIEQAFEFAKQPGVKGSDVYNAWISGRLMYDAIGSPNLWTEYKRRYQSGENPYLLEQELQNPWAELAGEFVLDPLNYFGVGLLPDKKAATAGKELLDVAPDIKNFLAATDEDAAAKLGEAAIFQVQKSAGTLERIRKWSESRNIWDLTATGKRYVFGRRVNNLVNGILSNSDTADDAIEALEALSKLAGSSADEVAEGLAFAKHSKFPRLLLSDAGNELGHTLRGILNNADGVPDAENFLNGLRKAADGGMDQLINFADDAISKAVDDLFPSLAERIKAGERVSRLELALADIEKTTKPIYGKINSFFSNIYMGYSPGFAFRNLTSNLTHVMVDEGPQAAFSFFDSKGNAKALEKLLGYTKKFEGFGVQAAADVKGGGPFSRLSEKFESWAALAVQRRAVERVMSQMLEGGRGLPPVQSLIDAGLSPTAARGLLHAVLQEGGDVTAASSAFMRALESGSLDLAESMTWLGSAQRKALQDFGLYDDLVNVIQDGRRAGKPLGEVAADVRKLYDDFLAKANGNLANDLGGIAADSPAAGDIANMADGLADALGAAADEVIDLAQDYRQANTNAWEAGRQAIDHMLRGGMAEAQAAGDGQRLGTLQALQQQMAGLFGAPNEWRAGREVADQVKAFQNTWIDKWYNAVQARHGRGEAVNFVRLWDEIGNAARQYGVDLGEAPRNWGDFRQRFWLDFIDRVEIRHWNGLRDGVAQMTEEVARAVGPVEGVEPMLARARQAFKQAQAWDSFTPSNRFRFQLAEAITNKQNANAARILARQFGISSISDAGVPLDQKILNFINANLQDGLSKFAKLDDVPPDIARDALLRHALKGQWIDLGEAAARVGEAIDQLPRPNRPYNGGVPSAARVITEQAEGLRRLFDGLVDDLGQAWGKVETTYSNPQLLKALEAWTGEAGKRVAEIRTVASAVGDAARDFTILSYPQKRGFDLALAYVFPYQFWYSRSYANWMKRLASNPAILANYAKYKNKLAAAHAGLPEWWKYQINSDELLGIDTGNPIFFNLEASLNPLNGLTGIDFDIPERRVNWWTQTLDNLGKAGPSIWTPISLATALGLYLQGEKEAASYWGGRVFPQTAVLKSVTALMNLGPAGGVELDPAVWFFSGGLDPFEQKRVGRALATLYQRGDITQEQMVDAGYARSGPVWQMAMDLAQDKRAWGQLSSFLLGVGFKGRSQSDMAIDTMYSEMARLRVMRPNMSAEEYSQAWDDLRARYGFMDAVLMSRKGGSERDEAYSWNIVNRLPPGQKSEILAAVGLDGELLNRFYQDKGDISSWSAGDRSRWMIAMSEIGGLLAMPDNSTRAEWRAASGAYSDMTAEMVAQFGENIEDLIDHFYSLGDGTLEGQRARDAFLQAHPEVDAALAWKTEQIYTDDLLSKYYGGQSNLEAFFRNQMFDEAEKKFGADISDIESQYWDLKNAGSTPEAKQYLKSHPELREFWTFKKNWRQNMASSMVDAFQALPEGPEIEYREDAAPEAVQDFAAEPQEPASPYEFTWSDWQSLINNPTLQRLVEDHVYDDDPISPTVQQALEDLADSQDIDYFVMLDLIKRSIEE